MSIKQISERETALENENARLWQELFAAREQGERMTAERDVEIERLHTTMMAAAVEISEHWDAHCDPEGYGPCNLVRRLENGFPAQYGYDAKTVVRMDAKIEAQRRVLEQALNILQYAEPWLEDALRHRDVSKAITEIQEQLK